MATNSKIEWTETTWNPVVGCSIVSPGCHHCYAATMAKRLRAMGRPEYQNVVDDDGRWTGVVSFVHSRLRDPFTWKKPRRVFVNSMSDLFHEHLPDDHIDRVFAVMALNDQHTFQVLTKRPERMAEYLNRVDNELRIYQAMEEIADAAQIADFLFDVWPLPNVWLGTSCEDQKRADERIPHLLRCPAAVHFLSCEPLLGPIDLLKTYGVCGYYDDESVGHVDHRQLDWIIAGGESGPHARPMHPDWPKALRDQCVAAGVPFFFKQWGEWQNGSDRHAVTRTILTDGRTCDHPKELGFTAVRSDEWHSLNPTAIARVGKKSSGRILDGREWNEFPQTEAVR